MTEQNNELAIAAFKKGDFALPCENADELYHLRYLKDTYVQPAVSVNHRRLRLQTRQS